MKILIVASDKQGRFAPFIEEQMTALQARGVRNTINDRISAPYTIHNTLITNEYESTSPL